MSYELTVLVPSRLRPSNLRRLIEAVCDTAPGASLVARVDDDDPHWKEYSQLEFSSVRFLVKIISGVRSGFVASLNELVTNSHRPYIALLGDDVLPETQGWGDAMIEALDGKLGVAYGDDGLREKHAPDLPTHPVLPLKLAQILGWAALPTVRHLFPDNAWRDLGMGLDNFPFVDVKLTHLHPWAGKAERDQTYTDGNDPTARDLDRAAYEAWRDSSWGLARALDQLKGKVL